MPNDMATATVSSARVERVDGSRQQSIVLALLALVIVVDQATKWWAWRHVPGTIINYGGNAFVGPMVDGWYADPVTGAALDLVGVGLLSFAAAVLWRRPRPTAVLISGALVVGGWSSNLLDRLGAHYWSAPGSVRGAVDFIPLGPVHYNVADVFIVSGTLLLLLAVGCRGTWVAEMPAVGTSLTQAVPHRPRIGRWVTAVAVAAVVVGVGIGAADYGGSTAPTTAFDGTVASPIPDEQRQLMPRVTLPGAAPSRPGLASAHAP